MKFLGQLALGFLVMAVLGVIIIHCDAGRGRAQVRQVNTITRTVARATVTSVTIEEPAVTFVSVVVDEPEAWFGARRLTPEVDGCAEYSAHRLGERTRYRVRICRDGTTSGALSRM